MQEQKARFLGTRFPSIIWGWILQSRFSFYHRRLSMKALEDYIAFDLEFNQYEGAYQIIPEYLPYVSRTVKKSTTTFSFR